MKKPISLDWIRTVLRGIVEGTLELKSIPTGKKTPGRRGRPRKNTADPKTKAKKVAPVGRPKKAKAMGKPGRPAMSPAQKRMKLEKAKAKKIRQAKKTLPAPRDIFLLLHGKLEGLKISEIAKHFQANRTALKGFLGKLVGKGDLDAMKGRYYLHRRIRKVD